MKKIVISLMAVGMLIAGEMSHAEEQKTAAAPVVEDNLFDKLIVDHLTFSANAERSNKVLKVVSSEVANELTYENAYSLSLKYAISPLGIYNAFSENRINLDGNPKKTFWDNITFYVQGTVGDKVSENGDSDSVLTLKTTDETSYKYGVSFNWCLGTYKGKCDTH